jgi:Txe/YoeB family toxin of Txe-Axe toxin-antitoxin module
METFLAPKIAEFFCDLCDYKCSKQSEWSRHSQTTKHISRVEGNKMETFGTKVAPICICSCGKEYTTRAGLWKHKKKCSNDSMKQTIEESEPNNLVINKELIMMILKQNQDILKENSELKHIMMDTQNQMFKVIENGTHNTTNSHNKTFNLNMFLNETCKNAMNINEFVDSLQLQMSDLENVGEAGYIEGISSIIIKKLNTLDITERPIHCTDKKRETMYIKDENKWEKEDEKKTKMHKLVTKVANKNINMISEFQKLHPEWKKCSSKYADQHNKIVIESMGGKGDNEYEKQEKIIKKIAKEVFVEKSL